MDVVGIASVVIFVFSLFAVLVTGRFAWITSTCWCIPNIFMSYLNPVSTDINGLAVFICFYMILLSLIPVIGVKMWNIRRIKKPVIIVVFLSIINSVCIAYCVYQIKVLNFIYKYFFEFNTDKGIINGIVTIVIMFGAVAVLYVLSLHMTNVQINTIDRFFSLKKELVLIRCNFIIVNNLVGSCFLEGINNGEKIYFKLVKRTYLVCKSERSMVLDIRKGCFGGIYVVKNPSCAKLSKAVRMDEKLALSFTIVTILLVLGFGFYYIQWA